jgi:radical SAM superfamily enzyme YgiQ (UPF0313 family)
MSVARPRLILTGDRSLETTYRENYFVGYLSSLPIGPIPPQIFRWFYPLPPSSADYSLNHPHLSLRTLEAILSRYPFRTLPEIRFIDPERLVHIIRPHDIILISTMDPLGIGPATSSWQMFGVGTPFHVHAFWKLLEVLQQLKHRIPFTIIVGGAGAWQLLPPFHAQKYGIDYIFEGEAETSLGSTIERIINGETLPPIIHGLLSSPGDILPLLGPSNLLMTEISRGCGRMCQFCSPTQTGKMRSIPLETIITTARNFRVAGHTGINLQSEDTLRYGSKNFTIDTDQLLGLFRGLHSVGMQKIFFTHATFANIASSPDIIAQISREFRNHGQKYTGFQPGLESGSDRLMRHLMGGKFQPMSDTPWPEIVLSAMKICHEQNWVPTASVMLGLPGENDEDLQETDALITGLIAHNYRFIFAPLLFVPVPATPLERKSRPRFPQLNPLQKRIWRKMWKYNFRYLTDVWNLYNLTDYQFAAWKHRILQSILKTVAWMV